MSEALQRRGEIAHRRRSAATINLSTKAGYFKSQRYTITVSREGYGDRSYTLRSSMDGWYWGNLLIGGLIGMLIVDPATGAMYKLPPSVSLVLDATADAGASGLTIASIDALNAEQKARLVPLQ